MTTSLTQVSYANGPAEINNLHQSKMQKINQLAALVDSFYDSNSEADSAKFYGEILLKTCLDLKPSEYQQANKKELIKAVTSALSAIGNSYFNYGNIKEALIYFDKGLTLCRDKHYKAGIALFLNEIGHVMRSQNDPVQALTYFEEALALTTEIKDSVEMAKSLSNLGAVYNNMAPPNCVGNEDSCLEEGNKLALTYYEKSLAIALALNHQKGIAQMYNNMAYVYRKRGLNAEAESYYLKSLALRYEIADSLDLAYGLTNIGSFYFKIDDDMTRTLRYANEAYALAERLKNPARIRDAAQLLVKIAMYEKNYEDAFNYYAIYIEMYDSVLNLESQKLAFDQALRDKYEHKKKLDEIENEKKIALEVKSKENQKVLTYAIGIGLVLVIAFLFFVFNRLKITQKQKKLIEQQNEIVEKSRAELQVKNTEILDSINYAKRIQNAILPTKARISNLLGENAFVFYKPKDVVAGDFYWLEETKEGILFAAADCTGHGVPGAMVSVVCNNALNRAVREDGLNYPDDILNKTRDIIIDEFSKSDEDVKDGMDIALCLLKGLKLTWSGANNPLIIIRNGDVIEHRPDKQPVGKFDYQKPFTRNQIDLEVGDTLYIFSDGYVDQFGGIENKKLKKANFIRLLLAINNQNMDEQRASIEAHFKTWMGNNEQVDDVCVVGLRI